MGGLVLLVIGAVVLLFLVSAATNLVFSLFIPVLIWGLIGFLAGRTLRGRGFGLLGNIGLGLVGGIVGSFLFRIFGLGFVGDIWLVGNIIVGVIGAVVLIGVVRLLGNRNFAR